MIIINALCYDSWSQYYDPENREITEINRVLRDYCGIVFPWEKMCVLEIGCGTGRFTKKIIKDAAHIDAIDPDRDRIDVLKNYLSSMRLDDKCSTIIGTFSEFLKDYNYENKYDLIIFSWSWAFIPDKEKEENILGALKMLKKDGVIISTMVEAGQYEEVSINICSRKNNNFVNSLERNAIANEKLRKILLGKHVFVSETIIDTYFQFDDYISMKNIVYKSLPEEENISEEDVNTYFHEKSFAADKETGKFTLSDIVRCIVIKQVPANGQKAKITFNYKLCDNSGGCSAANECRKYRSAIIRLNDSASDSETSGRWGVLTERCNPELCGKKCESVCELFSIHRFWPEVYESLRQIEQTAIEPDFFDKDRFGSGSCNPDHKTTDFYEACACFDKNKAIQILEISDARRHASSFDSVLITDLISRAYYDRYFTKYDIPKMEEENSDKVTLYEDDNKYEDIYKNVLEKFMVDELPALLVISFGKIVFKHEGIVRNVDAEVVEKLKEEIANVLRRLSEVI